MAEGRVRGRRLTDPSSAFGTFSPLRRGEAVAIHHVLDHVLVSEGAAINLPDGDAPLRVLARRRGGYATLSHLQSSGMVARLP